jgi:hypothetical protein
MMSARTKPRGLNRRSLTPLAPLSIAESSAEPPEVGLLPDERQPHCSTGCAGVDGTEGVLFVGRAQEKTGVFRTEKRRNPVGAADPPPRRGQR